MLMPKLGDMTMTEKTYLNISDQDGVTVVRFDQALILDTYHIDEVSRQLFDLVEADNRCALVLDFSTIKMLSSQTLGVMLKMKKKLDEKDRKMVVSGIDPRLYRVFKVTNLQNIFEFFEDKDSAVKALRQWLDSSSS